MDFRQLDKYYLEHTNNGKTETAAIVNKVPYSDRRLEWSIRDALKGAVNPDAHGTYVYVTDITRDKKEIYSEVEQAVDAGRFTGKPDRAEKHWANGNPNILIIPKPDKKTMKTWWRAAGSDSLFDSYPEELTTAGIVASDEVRQEFLESYLDYGLHYNDAKERKPWKLQLDKSFPVNEK